MCTRVLCLGNDLLADDAFGFVVARKLCQVPPEQTEVVETPEAGLHLLDYILHCSRLIVVDTILTGRAAPGTIYILREKDLQTASGSSPHYIGLLEILAAGRKLNLPVPEEVVTIAVEAADCLSVGGTMHPQVQAAVQDVVALVQEILHEEKRPDMPCLTTPKHAR